MGMAYTYTDALYIGFHGTCTSYMSIPYVAHL